MIRIFISLFFTVCIFTTAAHAEMPVITNDAQLVGICSLIDYQDNEDKVAGADYVPGVDVHGHPVASANVDGDEPRNYRFYFSLDLAERYMDLPSGAQMESEGAELDIMSDGSISFGGEDRTQEFIALCKERYGQ